LAALADKFDQNPAISLAFHRFVAQGTYQKQRHLVEILTDNNLLEPLIHLPALLFLENYNDFIMTTLFSWFILLASFFHAKDEKITKSLEDISSLLNRRPLLTGLALIYLATFATLKPNPTVISFLG